MATIEMVQMADMSRRLYKWMKRILEFNGDEVKEKNCRLYPLNRQSSYGFGIDFNNLVLLRLGLPSDLSLGGFPTNV
jgi:hypothetical protein